MQTELVSIASGSVQVEGMLELPDDPVGIILFAHGSGSSRLSPRNNFVAGMLRDARLGTLLMDLLTPQEDQMREFRFDIGLLSDRLESALAWVQHRNDTKPLSAGLFGASTGAAAALHVAAAHPTAVAAVVSRGGRPDLASASALAEVAAPTLLIVGGLDGVVIDLNRAAYASLRCNKEISIVPGASHLFEEPGKLQVVGELARDWFVRHLDSHQ